MTTTEDSSTEDSGSSTSSINSQHHQHHLSASMILEETKADNANFRDSSSSSSSSTSVKQVPLRSFQIALDTPLLHHPMRPDTQLTILDIPGINEAVNSGTGITAHSNKYKDYVNDHWHTFDVVILMMDVRRRRQGVVNTAAADEEQLHLLQLAKDNNIKTKKDVHS